MPALCDFPTPLDNKLNELCCCRLEKLSKENECTAGLSTIGDEKKWNVFMRLDNPAVQ